jgi:hypothetical protein
MLCYRDGVSAAVVGNRYLGAARSLEIDVVVGASVRASSAISAKVGGTTTMRGRGMGELDAELAIGVCGGGGEILQQEKGDLNQASPYRRRCALRPRLLPKRSRRRWRR